MLPAIDPVGVIMPTAPLGWWEDGEILGGRDEQAGGTWLACTRDGKLAFLTNFREIVSLTQVKSRGDLPVRFLKSKKSPKEFAEELMGEVDKYNGFNLVAADLCSMTMVYITNRPKENGPSVTEVSPGIHVLSNATLDTPWAKGVILFEQVLECDSLERPKPDLVERFYKVQRLQHSFEDVVKKDFESEISAKDITESLMNDTTKDDESKLPGICSPDYEYPRSAIFVDADSPSGRYGTRSTSAVIMKHDGELCFYERSLEKEAWQDHTISYRIKTEKSS